MYQNPSENYEIHENRTQPKLSSDTFYNGNIAYDAFSTTRDNNLNNHPPYITAPNATSNTEQYYSTTSYTSESTSYIGQDFNDQQNSPSNIPPHNNPPTHSPGMNNASSSQIQTVKILGYDIIIIPTSSPLASLISLDVQHQLQQVNVYSDYSSYSVNPPQLQDYTFANGYDPTFQYPSHAPQSIASDKIYLPSSPQIQTVEISGYKIIIIPTSSPLTSSTNLDMNQQFQQDNTYVDYSRLVNPPQIIQQHYFSSEGETSINENVIHAHIHVSDNTQPQFQQQDYSGLNESLNNFNNFFG
ncbi:15203_t:CDS:1 [Funneliformis caledonium]|uniref:15203_t:CDS:1 n=1 Tax=Funneliformis caledonium TaxID=1117310 RepID=A0A9N9FZ51_9GLOM|nr:15203_t:CDS:1 [Funneliformis caledonium]